MVCYTLLMFISGNNNHKKILKALTELFRNDNNLQAFIIFGSVARGNFDKYSDLDLDAIVKDVSSKVIQERVKHIQKTLVEAGFQVLSSFEEHKNEQVIILDTLDRVSIRFHTLQDTKNAILSSMQILCGTLTKAEIMAATKKTINSVDLSLLSNKFLELSVYVPISLFRNELINAQFFVNKMRQMLIQIYIHSYNLTREFDFEKHANIPLVEQIKQTYCKTNKEDIKKAFLLLLSLYESNIHELSNNRLILSNNQLKILRIVKSY
jgi:predicted nucleotidyltransferase